MPNLLPALARLVALCSEARARAAAVGRGVLVSMVEPVPPTGALDELDALEAMALSVEGRAIGGSAADRMYWTRPADGFSLAGFGSAVVMHAAGATRFASIDREWRALIGSAVLGDPSGGAPGAGPLLMGGFAFDSDGTADNRWRGFPAARFVVPRIQLASTAGGQWLTMNMLVSPDGEPDVDSRALVALRNILADGRASNGARTVRASAPAAVEYTESRSASSWRESVAHAVANIRDGALEKVVLAREVVATAPREFDVAATLRYLRTANRDSFVFGCWQEGGESAFVGASPELLVRTEEQDVRSSSLAGSVSRGQTAEEDAALAAGLLSSAKDRLEHEIVRRELSEGLADFCDDVVADGSPSLLTLPQVHHLHTDVRARLRPDHSLLELVGRLHPTPAVGGAPRERALAFIRDHEQMERGWYAGPIGWLQRERGEFAVALRSALVTGNQALLFAGCGIVADSDPAEEYAESLLKLRPMEMALTGSVVAPGSAEPIAVPDGRAVAR